MIDILTSEVEVAFVRHDPRLVRVLREYFYLDRRTGVTWEIPEGLISDGASIPRIVWSLSGATPFIHKGREAAFPHDHQCVQKILPYREVHEMYYHCQLDLGADPEEAKTFYNLIMQYGPQWNEKGEDLRALADKAFEDSVDETY